MSDATGSTSPEAARSGRRRAVVMDVIGVTWVVLSALAVLAVALAHGSSLGPLDWLSRYGLSQRPGVVVHAKQSFDQIAEMIPWTTLAWTQVHHGHLPLWNPYSALGMPLAFNWQSATFSVPVLLGYVFPLRLAYTVAVVANLVIAGVGVYVLGRVLRLTVVACAMAGVIYELSGPFLGWLGWPVATVMAWAGWLIAAAILVVRGRRRAGAVAFLAVVMACAIYGGQPDMLVLLGLTFVVFVVVLLGLRAPQLGGSGPIRRPARDLATAVVAAIALAAPLLLPGLPLLAGAVRGGKALSKAVPLSDAVHLLFQGFDGLPVAGNQWFGPAFYVRTALYMGAIALVLAILAVGVAAKRRARHHETIAMAAVAIVMAAVIFIPVVESILEGIPKVGAVLWRRATEPMAFSIAVLAGIGTDIVVRSHRRSAVLRWAGGLFAATGVVVLGIWLFGRGQLPPGEANIRAHSFIWPAIEVTVGLLVIGALAVAARRSKATSPGTRAGRAGWGTGTVAGVCLLVCETAFLVSAGSPIWSSSPTYLAPTAAEAAYQRAVGSALVGFGTSSCFSVQDELGIVPDVNDVYGVRELAVYDPLYPRGYNTSWLAATGRSAAPAPFPGLPFSIYCPAVTTVSAARLFGVGLILEPAGARGPAGTVFDTEVGGEKLFRVPGAAPATLSALRPDGTMPSPYAAGSAVAVTHPDPETWRMVTDGSTAAVLRLRLTDVPGWHATMDGHPLALQAFYRIMLQARVPAGHHVIVVSYWPTTFSLGLVVAGASAVALAVAVVLPVLRRRRRGSPRHDDPSSAARAGTTPVRRPALSGPSR